MSQTPRKRPTVVTVMAILNIVFGSLCILQNAGTLLQPVFMKVMVEAFEREQAVMNERQERREAELSEAIAAAETEEERDDLIAERDFYRQSRPPDMTEMFEWMESPAAVGYFVADGCLSMLGNILFILSGIGLLLMKPWARKMAIAAAIFKLVLALGLSAYYGVIVVPAMMAPMDEFMKKAQQNARRGPGAPPPPPAGMFKTMGLISGIGGALFMFVFSSIYPTALLITMTRPEVRAAFGEGPVEGEAEVFD